MFPTICQIGPFTVYSYGFTLAVAVIVCTFLLRKDAQKAGVNPEIISDLIFNKNVKEAFGIGKK